MRIIGAAVQSLGFLAELLGWRARLQG